MTKPLGSIDWLIIIALAIVAIVLVYLFSPLIIAILVMGAAYLIYKWYQAGRPIRPT
jgi:hypothetical protein